MVFSLIQPCCLLYLVTSMTFDYSQKRPSTTHRKCRYCHRFGHTIDQCWKLHKHLPCPQLALSDAIRTTDSSMVSMPTYENFLRWVKFRQSSAVSGTNTGKSFSCNSMSPSLNPRILDSGATHHITGNKDFFSSSLTTSGYLPSIITINGSETQSTGIGTVKVLPSLSITSVLYVPGAPFNLISLSQLIRSHDCIVTFTKGNVILLDRISGRQVGVGCESNGLYYLVNPSTACPATYSPLTIHAQLGHPSLLKLQRLVPSLLSELHCESCQLGKHTRSHFPDRVNKRASSPFALVHSDVWGPSRHISTLDSKYCHFY